LTIGAKVIEQGVAVVAEASAFHPVRDYLQSLHWDGVKRLPTWLSTYCGVEASPYAAAVGARWLISAVARPMDPGCQLDCCLIVEDPRQGTGKSSAFRALVPDPSMYSETGVTLGDKDSYQALHGAWIYLLDELDSLRRSDVTRTKNFLTSVKDHYRPSYGRVARDFARQNVFAGTTNAERYFADRTGNRRFWPVRTRGEIDVAAIRGVRDQLWAEAFDRYANGERWHVDTPELRRLCEEQQADRVADDPWEQLVGEWLAEPD
jgi:putative DNA primase/helicase